MTRETTDAECWQQGRYLALAPDSSKRALLFFEEIEDVRQEEISRKREAQFRCSVKLVFWCNMEKMGTADYIDDLSMYIIKLITAKVTDDELPTTGTLAKSFVNIKFIRKTRNEQTWKKYGFSNVVPYLFWPYDFFEHEYQFDIIVPLNCLSMPDISPETDCSDDFTEVHISAPTVLVDDQEFGLEDDDGNVLTDF